jgi:LEA14-like dessication related protein
MKRLSLAALLGLVAACAGPQKPTFETHQVRADHVEIKDQNFTTFTPMAVVPLENAAPVHLVDGTYEVQVRGQKIGSGKVPLDLTVQPGESVKFVTDAVPYAPEDKTGEVLEIEGSLPIVVRGEMHADNGDIYEFSRAGNVRTPRVPTVKVWHIEVTTYPDEDRLAVLFFVRVVNKNPFDIQLEELSYNLEVGGKTLVTDGVAGTKEVIGAATGGQIELPVDITKQNFGDVKKLMRNWNSLPYRIQGDVRLGVGRMAVSLQGQLGDEGDRFEEGEEKEQKGEPADLDDE